MNTDGKELNVGEQVVVSYLKGLNGMSTGHIQELAEHITVESGTEQIRDKIFRMWMIMACAAADHAESITDKEVVPKFGSIMILGGEQGIGKTRFLRAMIPKPLQKYFVNRCLTKKIANDLIAAFTDKEVITESFLYWVIEINEIDNFLERVDIGKFKEFLNRSVNTIREPYGKFIENNKRRAVFVGSTNNRGFLNSYRKSRHYWILLVEKLVIPTNIELIDNAWAEAWTAYISGEQWWPQSDVTNIS